MGACIRALIVCIALTLTLTPADAAEPVRELPTLGGADAQAEDINDLGQIVGWSQSVGIAVEATIWNSEIPSSLGTPAGLDFSFANAINNMGEVAGYSELGASPGEPGNFSTATFWGAGSVVDIGAEMAFSYSTGYDINDNGIVALQGDHPGPFGFTAGWVWKLGMGGIPAGADPIYRFGANLGINNQNDIVGYASAGFDGGQAILTRFNGVGWDTGIEIGPQAVRFSATAEAISDSGIVVGVAGDDDRHVSEAVIYTLDPRRPVVWLDTLDDFEYSKPLDVNDSGLITGQAVRFIDGDWELRAVVWDDEQIYDLNHLLRRTSSFCVLIGATGVNENNDVVGYGRLDNGDIRPFVIPHLGQGQSSGLLGHPRTPANLPCDRPGRAAPITLLPL
jgi:uncharacterized membrane protein